MPDGKIVGTIGECRHCMHNDIPISSALMDKHASEEDSPTPKRMRGARANNDYFVDHFCRENLAAGETPSYSKETLRLEHFDQSLCTALWGKVKGLCEQNEMAIDQFHIQPKLLKRYEEMRGRSKSTPSQLQLYRQVIGRYMDLVLVSDSRKDFMPILCLHALNHVMRTRSLVIANKQRLEQMISGESTVNEDLIEQTRDQGLARPKVLILCPFRKYAHRVVRQMIGLMFGKSEQPFVTSLTKFEEEFGDDGNRIHEKRDVPDEFKKMMSGNVDDCFRLGIGLAKKCLKLYTNFDESDILLCSPLGLRMITGDDEDERREYDFLASIEVLIVDKANILLMQNWEHLVNLVQTVNTIPGKVQTDISRVRHWSLNDMGRFYRQTLIFSDINFAELHALSAEHCKNFAGKLTLTRIPSSRLESIQVSVFQEFYRFEADDAASSADERFNYFIRKIMPGSEEHTLVFISSYFDFVRLRNHFKRESESFVQVHEYADKGKVAKGRQQFFLGQKKFMLFTERLHFYYRYKIKGVKRILFYQLPVNPDFYPELINMAHPDVGDPEGEEEGEEEAVEHESVQVKVLYSRFDLIRLQNIFGVRTARELVKSEKRFHAMIGE